MHGSPSTLPQCTGRDQKTCVGDPSCYWSGNSCVAGASTTLDTGASTTLDTGARGAAHDKTPVLYSCAVEGVSKPLEGLAWVDSVQAKTGAAGPAVEDVVRARAGVADSAHVSCSVHIQPKHDAQEWLHRRMASNCAPRFDLNEITTINHFQCYYEGTGVVDGKRVRRPFYHIDGRLASCDGYNEYMETSDEVMESIKLYAYHKAGGKEAQLDPSQFVCMVQSLPHK